MGTLQSLHVTCREEGYFFKVITFKKLYLEDTQTYLIIYLDIHKYLYVYMYNEKVIFIYIYEHLYTYVYTP